MSSERDERPWLKMIQQRQQRVEALIDECKRSANAGGLSPGLKRELAVETEGLYRHLDTDDELVSEDQLPDISAITERTGKQITTLEAKNTVGGGVGVKRCRLSTSCHLSSYYGPRTKCRT
jgi:hypothetical protein